MVPVHTEVIGLEMAESGKGCLAPEPNALPLFFAPGTSHLKGAAVREYLLHSGKITVDLGFDAIDLAQHHGLGIPGIAEGEVFFRPNQPRGDPSSPYLRG